MTDRFLHERASALFLEVRDLPPDQQHARLDLETKGDARLLREVWSLLQHDMEMMEEGADAPSPPAAAAMPTSTLGDTPERIGPYRVLKRIGRGGSGFVMLAQQDQPVQRRVAIKIVPHAALDPDFAARFEVERRALERTDHPNIARILDAGRTADGLPYLVMDFIEGVPITQYCREHEMPLRERIDLMLDVCDAVQHAHQRGVIHRDLKPANILVSEHAQADGLKPVCRPRVLDFGIAKPIPEMFGSDSPPTVGMPLGTPAYMAPEQTGTQQSIDTRADVYAIGAVLYELACGRPPNDVQDGDPLESLRRIREIVPLPASRVRTSMPSEFGHDVLPRSMMNDFDCVLDRALEKDPARRYSTVAALAADLRRVLEREPIEARPPTRRYRAVRFAQRNRVLVTAMAIVIVAVLVGIVGLTVGLVRANTQRKIATDQTDAQREINHFLTDDLLAGASPDEQGENISALDLLTRAGARVDARFPGRPLIAASIHHTLGVAYTALGSYDDAERHLNRAIALRRLAAGANAPDTVRSEIAAAGLLGKRERLDEADVALTQVIKRARLILGPDDPALYAALNDLGSVYETLDRGPKAVDLLQESLAGRLHLLGEGDPQVLVTMSNLAMAYERTGDIERSLQMQIDALRIADAVDPPSRMTQIGLCNNVGATLQDLNRDQEAEPYLRRAAELAQDWLKPDHPDRLTLTANLASLESELGNAQFALQLLDEVIKVRTEKLGPKAFDTLTSRYAYWNTMWRARRFEEAAAGDAALLTDAEAALTDNHWFVIQTRAALALVLLECGRLQEALPHAEKAVAQFTALYGPVHDRTKNAADTLAKIKARLAANGPATPATLPAAGPT